jgi:ABC-type lipoprotein export system ATPase subunit
MQYRDVPARGARRAGWPDLLDRFQIVGKKDLYPAQLSGGQQQLVAVARAVITRPRLLLADEPTGGPAFKPGAHDHGLVAPVARRRNSIIQVTHNEAFANEAQRVIRCRMAGRDRRRIIWPDWLDGEGHMNWQLQEAKNRPE